MSWFYYPHPSYTVVYNMPAINYVQVIRPQHYLVTPNNSPHSILTLVVPAILGLIELKCQCKGDSPFEINPVTMWFGISCLLAYCTLCSSIGGQHADDYYYYSNAPAIRYASALFGSLCVASFASVLCPDKIKPVAFALYALLSARKHVPLRRSWQWIREKIVSRLFWTSELASPDTNSPTGLAFCGRFDQLPV